MDIDDLIARVLETPDDDAPRLVLADALIERGDPWGELIALSCGLDPDSDATDPRRARHDELWMELYGFSFMGVFSRGFFETLHLENRADIERAAGPAFALVDTLRLDVNDESLTALARSPLVAQVGVIDIDPLSDAEHEYIAVSPALVVAALASAKCHTLELNRIPFLRAHLKALFDLPLMPGLRAFALSGHPRLHGLLDDLPWPALEMLDLSLGVYSSDVTELLRTPALRGLRELDLSCNPIDDEGLHAIARTPFTRLARLDLDSTDMSDDGLDALLSAPALRELTTVSVGVTSGTLARALPRLAELRNVTKLEIHCESTPDALARLYRALETPLQHLRVSIDGVPGAERIPPFERPAFRELRALDLSFETLSTGALRKLAAAELPKLESLELTYCDIDAAGAAILAASPHLPRDLELGFHGNTAGDAAEALRARFPNVAL